MIRVVLKNVEGATSAASPAMVGWGATVTAHVT